MAITEQESTYRAPGEQGSPVALQQRYDNFIGGEWMAPSDGAYRP